jgi:hypothetical protein
MGNHECPGRCGTYVSNSIFACSECWNRLPAELRARISSAARGSDRWKHIRAMVAAINWYNDQARRALDA